MEPINVIYPVLDKWIEEYSVPGTIALFIKDLDGCLGLTIFFKDHAQIIIKAKLIEHNFAFESVLWHEFCHAEVWLKENRTEGHTWPWIERMLRKPWYVIGCIYAQIICIGK